MSSKRKSRGRQKIEMKKMTNESNLQVTFSKRRSGLFKKASELCTLCGASVALVVFSPGEKVFSFGHPNVETVINRYLIGIPPQNDGTMQFIEAHRSAIVHELNAQITDVNNQFEADKKHNEQLNRVLKETQAHFWWACPIEDMNRPHLEALKEALEELKKDVARHIDMFTIQGALPTAPHFSANGGLSSSNVSLHQPPPPPPPPSAQMFPSPEFFQNPMMQAHLYDGILCHHGYNNMGGYGFF